MTFAAMYRRLECRRPPSLTAMLEVFDTAEYLTGFVALIHEFLPKHEAEIMRAPDAAKRCEAFVGFFQKDYNVELAEYDYYDDGYNYLLMQIPIPCMGLNYSDYDEFSSNYSEEWTLMASIVSYPYYAGENNDGASQRIPLLDEATRLTSRATVDRIPAAGVKPDKLHEKLDGTKYEGLACFADWLHQDTGCWKMDVSYEDNPEGLEWTMESVKELQRQEPIMRAIKKKVTELESWLHEDLRTHFAELVNAVMGKPVPREQLNLPEENDE